MTNEIPKLNYTGAAATAVPLQTHEQYLQTVTAEPWVKISDDGLQLEGLCFDRQGDLMLCEVLEGLSLKLKCLKRK